MLSDKIFRLCVEATFDEIYNNIRIISVVFFPNKRELKYNIYIDRIVSDYDLDSGVEISSYLADDIRINKYVDKISENVIFDNRKYKDIEIIGTIIFKRREY
ncbi:hypothetical protein N5853_09740 [Bartonella sp. HY329]|uniref:hypothetical protein n=1 Tax=unclassified Bartonella TaxID=2645622 RepID=UPI0021CA86CE|nr:MULTISPECIES: hypothetical protein [unclassified Bartonella]UXM94388.1 hypothetical protein N5853_09740 [Bartonella sp. HY329]UXN08711.1 hypothetical protein N5852_09750 [Bartonella sp. HY328]